MDLIHLEARERKKESEGKRVSLCVSVSAREIGVVISELALCKDTSSLLFYNHRLEYLMSCWQSWRCDDWSTDSAATIQSHIISYLCLMTTFILLLRQSLGSKGPGGREAWFNGYREQNMLGRRNSSASIVCEALCIFSYTSTQLMPHTGVFITLWCGVAYFAKVIDTLSEDDGFAAFTTIRYLDYCFTWYFALCNLIDSRLLRTVQFDWF